VTRPLSDPVKTTFWPVSNPQLANATKALHTVKRLTPDSILSRGRNTDLLLILLLERNPGACQKPTVNPFNNELQPGCKAETAFQNRCIDSRR
jgi:hypothetical protein